MTDNLNTLSVSYMLSSKHSSAPQSPNLQYKPHAFQSISTCTVFSKMYFLSTIIAAAVAVSASPIASAPHTDRGLGLVGSVSSLVGQINSALPEGVTLGALDQNGFASLCADIPKELLGPVTEGLSTIDVGLNVADTLGPLGTVLGQITDSLPADLKVKALTSGGTANVCVSVPTDALERLERLKNVGSGN